MIKNRNMILVVLILAMGCVSGCSKTDHISSHSLECVDLPEGLEEIDTNAFYGSWGMT